MAKRILDSQLNYIVHKSNLERAQKEFNRLKRNPDTPKEKLEEFKARLEILKQKNQNAVNVINTAGLPKGSTG
jgi:phage shock protein A